MATTAKTLKTAEAKPAKTLADITGLRVSAWNDRDAVPLNVAMPSLIYGAELEIENIRYWRDIPVPDGVEWKEDHSLRNNGMELVTKPMTASVLYCVLDKFFNAAKLSEKNYSERCSVHIHANCLDLTPEQIASICLLYQVFEGVLFNWIGDDRDKNIFCVPWSETRLHYGLIKNLKDPANLKVAPKQWHKYTALNIIPLTKYGTIEFRHMAGTCDLKRIFTWVNLIGRLFHVATTQSLEEVKAYIIDLNSTSAYKQTLDFVFGDWAEDLRCAGYEMLLEEGVLSMKYSLLTDFNAPKTYGFFLDEARGREEEERIDFDAILQRENQRINAALAQQARPRARPTPAVRRGFQLAADAVVTAEQQAPVIINTVNTVWGQDGVRTAPPQDPAPPATLEPGWWDPNDFENTRN